MKATTNLILAGQHGVSTNILFNTLHKHIGVDSVIIEEAPKPWQILHRRAQKLGPFRVASQALFRGGIVPVLRQRSQDRRRAIYKDYKLDDSPIPDDRITGVPSINHDCTRTHLQKLNPAVVVLSGCRIVAPSILQCIEAPFVNLHAGLTPSYRGVHGGYWALACGEPEACGVTVHLVDAGIDTGNILEQTLIHPTADDNFTTYPLLQLAEGLPRLVSAVQAILSGQKPHPFRSSRPSKLWYHPTVGEYLHNRILKGIS